MSINEGFLTDLRTAELFFRICRRYKVESREARIALMRILTARGKAKYLRDVSAVTEGKRCYYVVPKDTKHAN